MQQKTQDKFLVKVNEKGIFKRIQHFFLQLFSRKKTVVTTEKYNIGTYEDKRCLFKEEIKKVEDEYTSLLKLQKKYRKGEIKEEELTEAQIESLCSLYDKQIADLKKSNEIRKQKLLELKNATANGDGSF